MNGNRVDDNNGDGEASSADSSPNETQPLIARSSIGGDLQLLSTRHAFAVLVTLQIGSGIFASPAQVDSNVPSPAVALIIWLLGGLLSWAGAASFAELGAALPMNGGMQSHLRLIYGDTMASLMAWIYVFATKPSAMAIASIVIADSLAMVFTKSPTPWLSKLIATLSFIFNIALNSINTTVTLRLSESFTGLKLFTVAVVIASGLAAVFSYTINPDSRLSGASDWHSKNWFAARTAATQHDALKSGPSTWTRLGHYSTAIYGSLWAYDGWDSINIVASEVRDPGQSLPKAIRTAMLVVLVSTELVNVTYYILLPWDSLSSDDAVAIHALTRMFGSWAGTILAVLIALSCFGTTTSNIFTLGRLTIVGAHDGYFPAILGQQGAKPFKSSHIRHDRACVGVDEARHQEAMTSFDAPIPANLLMLVTTIFYILVGNLRGLLTFVGMAAWLFYISTVVGLLILRRREPGLARPYRAPTYLPIAFVIFGSLILLRSAAYAPVQGGSLAALLVVGSLASKLTIGRRSNH